jgi:hypothetical protein
MMKVMPALTMTEYDGLVRLDLRGLARGQGTSLQEAADDLIRRLLLLVMAFRATGVSTSRELGPDLEAIGFLAELGDVAAAGGDIRELVFG